MGSSVITDKLIERELLVHRGDLPGGELEGMSMLLMDRSVFEALPYISDVMGREWWQKNAVAVIFNRNEHGERRYLLARNFCRGFFVDPEEGFGKQYVEPIWTRDLPHVYVRPDRPRIVCLSNSVTLTGDLVIPGGRTYYGS